ncbi:MAG: hypothetical protein WDO19_20840 [Bacteroidota bacterium]
MESVVYIQGNDGVKKFYLDFQYSPLHEPGEGISGIMITANDVTERVEARQKVEESENRFRNMVMQSPVAKTILRGRDHIIEMANPVMMEKIWRKKESEVVGKKYWMCFLN